MAARRHPFRELGTPVVAGPLGAVGALIAPVITAGATLLASRIWPGRAAAIVASVLVIGLLTVALSLALLTEVLWHRGVRAMAMAMAQFLLIVIAGLLLPDAVLNWRGVQVTAEVTRVDSVTQTHGGGKSLVCAVRLPDGTTTGLSPDLGCDRYTRVGDQVTVYQHPEGLVPPKHSLWISATQYVWLVGTRTAVLVVLGTVVGVSVALDRKSGPFHISPDRTASRR